MKLFKKKKDPEEWKWLLQLSKKKKAVGYLSEENVRAQLEADVEQAPELTQELAQEKEAQETTQEPEQAQALAAVPWQSLGRAKVARLLLALGPSRAADILQHLQTHEIEAIMTEMSKITTILPEERTAIIEEFSENLQAQDSVLLGGKEETRRFLVASLGEEKARVYLEKLEVGDLEDDLQLLETADPKMLAQTLSFEHEQIIAAVLSFLSPRLAAAVLSELEVGQRLNLVKRLAQVSHVHPQTMRHITRSLRKKMSSQKKEHTKQIGGNRSLANILSYMNLEDEKEMLAAIDDEKTRENVQSFLYTFDELLGLTESEMRILIGAIADDAIFVSALRASSVEMREHFLGNVSKNRRGDLEEMMEMRGAIRQSEIFQAREKIVALARKLDDEGRIQIKKDKEKWV